jgi:hypothetical protein
MRLSGPLRLSGYCCRADYGGWSEWLRDAGRREVEALAAAGRPGAARRRAGLPPLPTGTRGPLGAARGHPASRRLAVAGVGRLLAVRDGTLGRAARRAPAKASGAQRSPRSLRPGPGRRGARSATGRGEARGRQPPMERARRNAPHRRARPADGPPDPVRTSHAARRGRRLTERAPGEIGRARKGTGPAGRRTGRARRGTGRAPRQTGRAPGQTDRATGEMDHAVRPSAPSRSSSATADHGFLTRSPPTSSILRPGASCTAYRTTWPTAWLATS